MHIHLSKLVQLVQLGLGVELRIFLSVWEQRGQIVEDVTLPGHMNKSALPAEELRLVSIPVADASRREDQDPLLVPLDDAISRRLGLGGAAGLVERLVHGSHRIGVVVDF